LKPEASKPERRIGGGVLIIILVVGAVAGVALTVASIYINGAPVKTASMSGTLLISSSGQLPTSGSDPAYTATYNVTLAAVSGTGTMNFTLVSNSTDLLSQHGFAVSDFLVSPNNLTMVFAGNSVNLGWINNSTVLTWTNATYTGAWGQNATRSEVWGTIRAADFPGVPAGYYVVLSVTVPGQPVDTIPFVVAPVAAREQSPALAAWSVPGQWLRAR
jgi:hypothetical protein